MENPEKHQIRSWKCLAREVFDDERIPSATTNEQVSGNRRNNRENWKRKFRRFSLIFPNFPQRKVEAMVQQCFERFEQIASLHLEKDMPMLHRQEHIGYLEKSIGMLTSSYECLDSSRPWLVYWIMNSASVLNFSFSEATKANIVGFLKR